mmetsp:Transcript_3196/g.8465  ORF Transcript_3196/g.8465 Transcript_3196/m.8465 type:complete len:201 (+) Transcript_3196:1166-1768(+)
MHRPNVDAGHADVDIRGGQEGEQRLQRAQGGRLHAHALPALVHFRKDVCHICHGSNLQLLFIIFRGHHKHGCASHRGLKAGCNDLDTNGSCDLLVVHELTLHPHLLHHLRRLQCLDACHDGPAQAAHHNLVPLTQLAIDQHTVHSGSQARHSLDLQYSGLWVVHKHEPVRHHGLSELDHELEQVRQALSRDGGCGHHVHV